MTLAFLPAAAMPEANMWGIPFRQERTRYEYCLWNPEQSFRGEGPTSPELVKCYVTNSLIFASSWRGLNGFATYPSQPASLVFASSPESA